MLAVFQEPKVLFSYQQLLSSQMTWIKIALFQSLL